MEQSTTARVLRPDVARALRLMADGTPDTLIALSALRSLERLGYVRWADDRYGRELTDAGRQRAAELDNAA